MIILFNKEGRFAHQLNQFAMLIANSKEYECRFYYRAFRRKYGDIIRLDYAFLKERMSPVSFRIIGYLLLYWILRVFRKQELFLKQAEYHLRPNRQDELLIGDRIRILAGGSGKDIITNYILSDLQKLIRYRKEVSALIVPTDKAGKNAAAFLEKLRKQYQIVLGVHVRRGDYKDFANGAFYYTDGIYAAAIKRFLQLFPESEKIAVVICSDEDLERTVFSGPHTYYVKRPYYEDFFILRSCDYLIGPHSFFTLMSNYLGQNKLYQLLNPDNEFGLEDFWDSEEVLLKRYSNWRSIYEIS